jgi:hypothetical protein
MVMPNLILDLKTLLIDQKLSCINFCLVSNMILKGSENKMYVYTTLKQVIV